MKNCKWSCVLYELGEKQVGLYVWAVTTMSRPYPHSSYNSKLSDPYLIISNLLVDLITYFDIRYVQNI